MTEVVCESLSTWEGRAVTKKEMKAKQVESPSNAVCNTSAAPVVPDDYGTSWMEAGSDEGTAGCMVVGFAALAAPVLLVWLLVRFLGL